MATQATNQDDKTIALAGVYLALHQIQELAWHGKENDQQLTTSLQSLFVDEPSSYLAVFDSTHALKPGLDALKMSLNDLKDPACLERNKYLRNLLSLTKKLMNNNYLQEQVSTTLKLIEPHEMNADEHPEVIRRCAQLYQNTLSTLKPKIIIYGKANILATSDYAASIRSLLLCAVRSTLLWYQAGGSFMNIALGRSKYLRSIDRLLP